jgi:DNA invertase Pin-like site-specific DNA recombinase
MGRKRKRTSGNATSPKAVGYVRVSTTDQATNGVSLDAQEERIRAYCQANGLDLVSIYRDEGVSGGLPLSGRPEGKAMLAALGRGDAAHVVAAKLDRLFRNVLDCLVNVGELDKAGVSLHLLDLNLNTATAFGQAFLAITAAFAALERNLTRERIVAALAHKKQNGQVYNHVPYGFDRVEKRLVANAGEQAVLQRIKEMDSAGVPMMRIAEALNKEGVPTKRNAQWYASTVRAILTSGLH